MLLSVTGLGLSWLLCVALRDASVYESPKRIQQAESHPEAPSLSPITPPPWRTSQTCFLQNGAGVGKVLPL